MKLEEEFKELYKEAYELKNSNFDESAAYAGIESKYKEECEAAKKAAAEYAMQMKSNDLKSMQDEFYRIVNRGGDIRRIVAYSLLSAAWDGIGDWRK